MFAPSRLGPTVEITAFVLTGASTLAIALRFYCRWIARRLRSDDALILCALVCTWGVSVINYYQVQYGTGRHVNDQAKSGSHALKSWYAYQVGYLIDLLLVKLSILVYIRGIAKRKTIRIAIYITAGLVAAFTVAMILVNALQCKKPSDAWASEKSGSCLNLHSIYYAQAGFDSISNAIILVLPALVVFEISMKMTKRLALMGILLIGTAAVAVSALRLYSLHSWIDNNESLYDGAYILIWSQMELNAGLIAVSLPSLKPLFGTAFDDPDDDFPTTTSRPEISRYTVMPKRSMSLKRQPSRINRTFSNASDRETLFRDGLATQIQAGANVGREWNPETTYARPSRPPPRPPRPEILREVTVTRHSSAYDAGPLTPTSFTKKFAM